MSCRLYVLVKQTRNADNFVPTHKRCSSKTVKKTNSFHLNLWWQILLLLVLSVLCAFWNLVRQERHWKKVWTWAGNNSSSHCSFPSNRAALCFTFVVGRWNSLYDFRVSVTLHLGVSAFYIRTLRRAGRKKNLTCHATSFVATALETIVQCSRSQNTFNSVLRQINPILRLFFIITCNFSFDLCLSFRILCFHTVSSKVVPCRFFYVKVSTIKLNSLFK